ncbi:MAG: hypothetical protein R3E87_03510 [Burkholderiaceae bacterium]
MLERVGLDGAVRRNIASFSGGQRQRIGIARALASEAPLPGLRRSDRGARCLDRAQVINLFMDLKRPSTSPTCSSATISRWYDTSPTGWS